jgi:hypothetical protein
MGALGWTHALSPRGQSYRKSLPSCPTDPSGQSDGAAACSAWNCGACDGATAFSRVSISAWVRPELRQRLAHAVQRLIAAQELISQSCSRRSIKCRAAGRRRGTRDALHPSQRATARGWLALCPDSPGSPDAVAARGGRPGTRPATATRPVPMSRRRQSRGGRIASPARGARILDPPLAGERPAEAMRTGRS